MDKKARRRRSRRKREKRAARLFGGTVCLALVLAALVLALRVLGAEAEQGNLAKRRADAQIQAAWQREEDTRLEREKAARIPPPPAHEPREEAPRGSKRPLSE